MKIPGPDHPIAVRPAGTRIRVLAGDVLIADTARALVLTEATYPPVYYIPRADADQTRLVRSARVTHCPYKGDASYFSIATGAATLTDAVWSYETPFPAMAGIAGFLAFYPDKVTIEDVAAA